MTYAWMLDRKGKEYPCEVHYYVSELEGMFDSAVDCAKFILTSGSPRKQSSIDIINLCIASEIYDAAIEDDDMISSIHGLYEEGLEEYDIDEDMAIQCYNATKPYTVDTIEDYVENNNTNELPNRVKTDLNEYFCRVRIGGMIDSDDVASGEIVYRVSSHGFNWCDVIYQNVYDNKNKYRLRSVTVCRDPESDFGLGSNDYTFYKDKRGKEYLQMPIKEFLSGENDTNPCFEQKKALKESREMGECFILTRTGKAIDLNKYYNAMDSHSAVHPIGDDDEDAQEFILNNPEGIPQEYIE